jgi:hypothetical protein
MKRRIVFATGNENKMNPFRSEYGDRFDERSGSGYRYCGRRNVF